VIEIETASSTGENGGQLLHDAHPSEKRETCGIRGNLCPAIWMSTVRGATPETVLPQQDLRIQILPLALVRRIAEALLSVAFEEAGLWVANVHSTTTTVTDTTHVSATGHGDAVVRPLCVGKEMREMIAGTIASLTEGTIADLFRENMILI
jgi:hypothetical protein